jgi:hypothetical protein
MYGGNRVTRSATWTWNGDAESEMPDIGQNSCEINLKRQLKYTRAAYAEGAKRKPLTLEQPSKVG